MITLSQTHVIRLLVLGMLLILAATSGTQQRANVRDDIDPGFLNDNYWRLLTFHIS
jgi:hypothetical protein